MMFLTNIQTGLLILHELTSTGGKTHEKRCCVACLLSRQTVRMDAWSTPVYHKLQHQLMHGGVHCAGKPAKRSKAANSGKVNDENAPTANGDDEVVATEESVPEHCMVEYTANGRRVRKDKGKERAKGRAWDVDEENKFKEALYLHGRYPTADLECAGSKRSYRHRFGQHAAQHSQHAAFIVDRGAVSLACHLSLACRQGLMQSYADAINNHT
jgi:hypothetical protein